jgi:hypothetical protein
LLIIIIINEGKNSNSLDALASHVLLYDNIFIIFDKHDKTTVIFHLISASFPEVVVLKIEIIVRQRVAESV